MYKFQEISNFAEAPIVKKRKCTDTICLVVFISFIGVWSFVAITAFKYGNLKAALYPTDSFVSKYLYLNSLNSCNNFSMPFSNPRRIKLLGHTNS